MNLDWMTLLAVLVYAFVGGFAWTIGAYVAGRLLARP